MTRCESSLNCNDSKAIRLLILSLIDLKIIKNGPEIYQFFELTFYFVQQNDKSDSTYIYEALNYLIEMKLVSFKNKKTSTDSFQKLISSKEDVLDCEFEITKLGTASIKCGINLDWLPKLYSDLNAGLKHMVLSTNLHLLYLCTPYDLVNNLLNMDYDIYLRKVDLRK